MKDRFESNNKMSKDNLAMFAYARDGMDILQKNV
jgi:hypothetical protein